MVSTHLKNISQIWSFPQVVMKIKNMWNHHLAKWPEVTPITSWQTQTYPVSPSCHHLSSSRRILLSASPAPSVLTQGILFEKATQRKHGWNRWRSVCIYTFFLLAIYYYNSKGLLQSSNRVVIMTSPEDFGVFLSLLNFIYTSTGPLSLCRTPWDI